MGYNDTCCRIKDEGIAIVAVDLADALKRVAELEAANALALELLRERYTQNGKWHDGRAQQVAIELAAAAAAR